jgi:hypothetical protein
MALVIRVYVEGKLLAEGEVPGPLVAMPAKTPKTKGAKRA